MALLRPRTGAPLCKQCRPQPMFDFLTPSCPKSYLRHVQRASMSAQSASETTFSSHNAPLKPTPSLTPAQKAYLERALRVNQAGELAATLIYTAQTPPLVKRYSHLRPLLRHMYDQEASHLTTFNSLVSTHRVRPTAMTPIWSAAASFLGWSTAVMGREAAMACTEAVETEIGTHYNDQVRELLSWLGERESRGEEVGDELWELVETVRRIRDEELEHLDEAVAEGAREAEAYPVLTAVVRGGCRGAIWISERV